MALPALAAGASLRLLILASARLTGEYTTTDLPSSWIARATYRTGQEIELTSGNGYVWAFIASLGYFIELITAVSPGGYYNDHR